MSEWWVARSSEQRTLTADDAVRRCHRLRGLVIRAKERQ